MWTPLTSARPNWSGTSGAPEAICDTSAIQYLHQLRQLDLLPHFYHQVVVPAAVWYEIEQGHRARVDLPDLSALPWIIKRVPSQYPPLPGERRLGPGERDVLRLGMELPGVLLILDDRLGRLAAGALHLRFTGVLGILLRAKLSGVISDLQPCLMTLQQLGFRLSARTQADVLHLAGEG